MPETADPGPRRPSSASALAEAHNELLARCHAAERAGDWCEAATLSALVDVADYLKRIGDNPDSAHYRAEKAGALLDAAIRVQRTAMLSYGGWPEDDANEHAVVAASRLLERTADHVGQAMWHAMCAARGDAQPLGRHEAGELVHLGQELARWATQQRPGRSRGILGR